MNTVDLNLLLVCGTVLVALAMALVARRYDKITEAADKLRETPETIATLETTYADAPEAVHVLMDALNTAISLLHRSVPAGSSVLAPIAAVDRLLDEVMDDIPAAEKEILAQAEQIKSFYRDQVAAKTVTVVMPNEKGTSVEITS